MERKVFTTPTTRFRNIINFLLALNNTAATFPQRGWLWTGGFPRRAMEKSFSAFHPKRCAFYYFLSETFHRKANWEIFIYYFHFSAGSVSVSNGFLTTTISSTSNYKFRLLSFFFSFTDPSRIFI